MKDFISLMYTVDLEREEERKGKEERERNVPETWKSVCVKEKLALGEFTREESSS